MDELNVEELNLLVSHYNKRATEAEFKNAELQLLLNRSKSTIKAHQSKIDALLSENKDLYDKIDLMATSKPIEKATKVKGQK
jgi:hypothetical protein